MYKFNAITLNQVNKIHVAHGKFHNPNQVLAMVADLSQIGFTLEKELSNVLKTLSQKEIKEVHSFLVAQCLKMVGGHVKYKPLFVNFPYDVPEEMEYLVSRIIGFVENFYLEVDEENSLALSCGCKVNKSLFDLNLFGACPLCQRQVSEQLGVSNRKKIKEKVNLKSIGFISELNSVKFIEQMFASPVAYSVKTREHVLEVFNLEKEEVLEYLPSQVTNKENLAFLGAAIKQKTKLEVNSLWFKTATDILRLAVALSQGDISLKDDSNFKLTNSERKLVMTLLNNLENDLILEDMLRFHQKWLRLGEYLHVTAYQGKYPQLATYFNEIRNQPAKIATFNRKVHMEVIDLKNTHAVAKIIALVQKRPGEFARKLDYLLREGDSSVVISEFKKVLPQVSSLILLKLDKYLKTRTHKSEFRYFIPKGSLAKIFLKAGDNRDPLEKSVVDSVRDLIKVELTSRYAQAKPWDKVFIDPSLKKILVPTVQRNCAKSLSTVNRGSKVAFDLEAKNIRMFIYWHENAKTGRIDVDLSATGFNSDWEYVTNLSWTSLNSLKCQHSGDVQSAPNGASEFIDINLDSFRENKIRYVVMNVFSWTGQKFQDFECFAGVMVRNNPNSGEIYEPKTVQNKFDLAGDTTVNMPMILDLETNEIIWADVSFGSESGRRVENSTKKVALMGKSLLQMNIQEPNLFDLFTLHAKARGAEVSETKDSGVSYDIEFNENSAKNIVEILAKWI